MGLVINAPQCMGCGLQGGRCSCRQSRNERGSGSAQGEYRSRQAGVADRQFETDRYLRAKWDYVDPEEEEEDGEESSRYPNDLYDEPHRQVGRGQPSAAGYDNSGQGGDSNRGQQTREQHRNRTGVLSTSAYIANLWDNIPDGVGQPVHNASKWGYNGWGRNFLTAMGGEQPSLTVNQDSREAQADIEAMTPPRTRFK
jgi:hypothetical protein